MSDVSVAAPAAPSSAPAQTQIPVQVDQVNLPNPVPSQGVSKHGSEELNKAGPRPESNAERRRADIERAFGKANTEVRAERTKPREAKMGDNAPPEPTEKERKREPPKERLELKKRPDDQPPPRERTQQERGEHGHFVSKDAPRSQAAQPTGGQQGAGSPALHPAPALPEGARFRNPPRGMSQQGA